MSFHNSFSSKSASGPTSQSLVPRGYPPHSDNSNEFDEQEDHFDHDDGLSSQDEIVDERELDEELAWAGRQPHVIHEAALRYPVVVPQVALGITQFFQRAWAPALASYDVYPEEFLQFIDHLNICKTASPPLQVLNLAGTVAGFVPVHFAALAGLATNMIAAGGMVAVARIRIVRYLKRVNHEYFIPRGLVATIMKQDDIHRVTGQSPEAPMLLDSANTHLEPTERVDIVQQRMQAFKSSIARLVYNELPLPQPEQSMVDRLTAKMNARKASKGLKKDSSDRLVSKEQRKFEKKRAEAEEEAQEIRQKAAEKMAKKPKDRAKIEADMRKELAKLDENMNSDEQDYLEKAGKGGKKVEKKLKKLMFIVIQDAATYQKQ